MSHQLIEALAGMMIGWFGVEIFRNYVARASLGLKSDLPIWIVGALVVGLLGVRTELGLGALISYFWRTDHHWRKAKKDPTSYDL